MLFSFRALLCAALLYLFYLYFPAESFQKEVPRLRLAPLLLAAAGYLAIQLAATLRFSLALGAMGFRLPLARVIHLHFVSLFFNMLLPGGIGGDAAKGYYLRDLPGHWGKGFLAALLDRYLGFIGLASLGLASAALLSRKEMTGLAPISWILGVALLAYASPYFFEIGAVRRVLRWLIQRVMWIYPMARSADEVIGAARRPKLILLGSLLTLAYYAGLAAIHLAMGSAIGAELEYWSTLYIVTGIALVSALPLLPGAHGQREAAYVVLFSAYGLSRSQSFLLAALALGMLILGATVGGLSYLTLRARQKDGLNVQRTTPVSWDAH